MKRVIYNNNDVLSDFSTILKEYRNLEASFSFVAAEDAFYIGSDLPFNHFFLKMGTTVNAETSQMSVYLWDGTLWNEVVDVIDETSVAGASLAQDGFVTFTPDKNKFWYQDDTLYNDSTITGIGDATNPVVIYDKYWLKIVFSADLTADVAIKYLGEKFSDDSDLRAEYPSLLASRLLTNWESGKTDWEEQHVQAAKIVIKDLKAKKLIKTGDQILRKDDLTLASVSKVAEIIYVERGTDFEDDRLLSQNEYADRLNNAYPTVDKNNDAIVDDIEAVCSVAQGKLSRG